jgi:L-aspartate oxidase
VVLAKRELNEGATAWAQGGIVGVLGSDDSIDSHVRDTLDAGAGLVDEHTARFIAQNSAEAVEWLVERGVPFSPDPEGPLGLHLTREGGHAVRRIAHAADATGKAIHDVLLDEARAHPNITLRERWMALDLITSRHGARSSRAATASMRWTSTASASRRCRRVPWCWPPAAPARSTATRPTPTPPPATASRWPGAPAAASANMEFIQFHPTCLYHPQERSFLITEALRGEGGS